MDCNLPELLAKDLEFSSLAFTSKNMTAGPPAPALASDEPRWHTPPPSTPTTPCASCYHNQPGNLRFQPLGAIDEKSSVAGMSDDGGMSESASMSGTHSSNEMEIASTTRQRQQSIVTAATSVTSSTRAANSRKRAESSVKESDSGWADVELGVETAAPRTSIDEVPIPGPKLSPRTESTPQPQPVMKSADTTPPDIHTQDPQPSRPASRAMSTQPAVAPSKSKEQRRYSLPAMTVPARYSSNRAFVDPDRQDHSRHLSRATSSPALELQGSRDDSASNMPSYRLGTDLLPLDDEEFSFIADLKEEMAPWFRYIEGEESTHKLNLGVVSPTTQQHLLPKSPVSPLVNVQTWLETSIESMVTPAVDDHSRRIPLPPDVIETLRISMTCFPETMLLCSSLSIETIRTYSRKVKHHSLEPSLQGTRPQALPQTPPPSPPSKRWRWSNVLGNRRSVTSLSRETQLTPQPYSNEPRQQQRQQPAAPPQRLRKSSSCVSLSTSPRWSRLKSVFPGGSDYLCDALYAHLVAYNYVSSLCAQNQNPNQAQLDRRRRPPSPSSLHEISEDPTGIPRKAASLLGLNDLDVPPPPQPVPLARTSSRLIRKRSSLAGLRTAARSTANAAPAPAPDPSLRELQVGLAKCIGRLIATLRTSSDEGIEHHGPPISLEEKNNTIDPFLMRSLCEIVRSCEGSR